MNKVITTGFVLFVMIVSSALIVTSIDTQNEGHRVDSGNSEIIPYYDDGYKVHNNGAYDLFVPTRTESEFMSLYNNPPPNVQVTQCYYKSDCDSDVGCNGGDTLESYSKYSDCSWDCSIDNCANIYCCP